MRVPLDGLCCARRVGRVLALAALAWLAFAVPAVAQDDLEDVLGEIGTDTAVEGEAPAAPGEGTLSGRVFDGETGAAVKGATVILQLPTPEGAAPRQEVTVTAADGGYEFPSVPPGTYSIQFVKAGYRASTMTDFEVLPDQVNTADFPLPPRPTETPGEVLELEAFVVEASTVSELMTSLELRLDSDELLNIMSAEDLSRFAASDVADALKRVAGVNVVEGQFAIIRGLEDRYSSTTFNGAPVPSPDPDRQSVQLDLFPSEVVDNLAIKKSFAPDLPSNSSGGSIDILTQEYDDEWTFSLSGKAGLNENPFDGFLELREGNPVGEEIDGFDTLEQEYGGSFGGRHELFGREVRVRGLGSWGTDTRTREGFKEKRQPRSRSANQGPGDLAFGGLTLTEGRFDRTESAFEEQLTGYAGLGIDLDRKGLHKLDFAYFRTHKQEEIVQQDENAFLPGFDYGGPGGPVEQAQGDGGFGELVESGNFQGRTLPGRFSGQFGAQNPLNQNANGAWFTDSLRSGFILEDEVIGDRVERGALWFSSFGEARSVERERELALYQLSGDHTFDFLDDFHLGWVANHATTAQDERTRSLRHWYEPCGYAEGNPDFSLCPAGTGRIPIPTTFPVTVASLGEGYFVSENAYFLESGNSIDEEQWFGRIDADYERTLASWLSTRADVGLWYERVVRDVEADFLSRDEALGAADCAGPDRAAGAPGCIGEVQSGNPTLIAFSLADLGDFAFNRAFPRDERGLFGASEQSTNETEREILGLALGSKTTLWEELDLLAGLRVEQIHIESRNDPFLETFFFDGSPNIFPSKYLFFDRFDNPVRENQPLAPPFNDELLGFPVTLGPCRGQNPAPGEAPPPGPAPGLEGSECVDLATRSEIESLVNGEIDETKLLPSVGLTWRPLEGLTLRGAYSQTVARPSSRELGYYVSFDPDDDEFVVGNPQMQLSDVESFDTRLEYVFGDSGDLFAISGFYKVIEDPIESIVLRDPRVRSDNTTEVATFRTFFNNPDTARLLGVEVEGRKALDFVPKAEFLGHFSVGGNFTWIDAEVDRTPGELSRAERFFAEGQTLRRTRRLFGQPEWIANADVSFHQPDWGTKITLAYFAISDVLDALGTGVPRADQQIDQFQLDRYVDSFHQLDLVASQELGWGFTLKGSAKNLTDSVRRTIYDPAQTTGTIVSKELRQGREYSLSLTYTYVFGAD